MTKDDIIRMVQKADDAVCFEEDEQAFYEHFANLVAAAEREQIADALRRRSLTLVKTDKGYDVMSLGRITACGVRSQS